MSTLPVTPPAFVRPAPDELATLRRQLHEDYAAIRDLGERLNANHLVMMDTLGQFARSLAAMQARMDALERQNDGITEGIRHLVARFP